MGGLKLLLGAGVLITIHMEAYSTCDFSGGPDPVSTPLDPPIDDDRIYS